MQDVLQTGDLEKAVIVIDDFFTDPDAVRGLALGQAFAPDGLYPGERSPVQRHEGAFTKAFERFIGKPILRMESVFQIQPAGFEAQSYVHCDLCDWAAVVYLNPGHDGEPGTRFYRHRATGMDRFAFGLYPRGTPSPHLEDGKDLDKWEVTMTVPIRFNRLVLYNASLYHRNASTWGSDAQDARMVQSFFFSTRPDGEHLPEWLR